MVNIELRDKTTQRSDPIALTYAQDADIQAVCTSFQGCDCISDCTPGIIMTMKLDTHLRIALFTDTHELFDLARCGDTHCVRQTNALNPCFDDSVKNGQQINQIAAKRILGGEAYVASGSTNSFYERYSSSTYLFDTVAVTKGT